MATTTTETRTGPVAGARAGLDVLLTDAAVGNGTRRFIQPRAVAQVAAGVARHPRRLAARATGLGAELARVAAGRSEQRPAKATAASPTRRGSATGSCAACSRRSARPSTASSPTRTPTGRPSARRASPRAMCSTRSRPRTSRGPTRRSCVRSSTRAAPT